MAACWFCLERIRHKQGSDRHHVLCRRYIRKGANPDHGNLVVRVHKRCHVRWNGEHDSPGLLYPFFIVWMQAISFGYGVYAREEPYGLQPRQDRALRWSVRGSAGSMPGRPEDRTPDRRYLGRKARATTWPDGVY